MKRREFIALLAATPTFAATVSSAQTLGNLAGALKDPLVTALSTQLGLNDNQAKGGVGAFLSLAKEKLPTTDFGQLTKLIPNADSYMGLAKSLGAVSGPLKNVAGLNAALGKLGIKPETVAQFVPTVSNYLNKLSGNKAGPLLSMLIK